MIDAHVHFWDPEKLDYPWLSSLPPLRRPFLPTDLREAAKGCGLEGAVFVQADCAPVHGIDELHWVRQLADEHTWIRGIVPFAALERGDEARKSLESLAEDPRVKGVRRLIQSEPRGFCRQSAFVSGVKSLADFGLSFDLCLEHHQLGEVIELVDACPDTPFVLDHLAKPAIAAGLLDPWRSQIRDLARRPNVVCKISGLVTEADHGRWQREELKPYIAHAIDAFGFDRLLYGSDWPVSTIAGGYGAWWEALAWAIEGISATERQAFFIGNAAATYRLDVA